MARVKIGNVYPTDAYLLERCAPAGYGLGKADGKVVSTPDEALYNGFYNVKNDAYKGDETTTDWRLGWCSLLVERKEGRICQTAKSADLTWYRTSADGGITWEPWEWVNPPMLTGVEYRTTERWMGKPVYTKLFDFGASADGASIAHELNPSTIVRYSAVAGPIPLPHFNIVDPEYQITISVGATNITMACGESRTGLQTYVQLWYVKD